MKPDRGGFGRLTGCRLPVAQTGFPVSDFAVNCDQDLSISGGDQMRIDAVFILMLGAASYLKFMIEVYQDVSVALLIFLLSGAFGVFTGLACGSASTRGEHEDH